MIFLGVEQAPQKIQFAIAKRSHFAVNMAMCRVAKRGFFVCLQTEKHLRQARQK